VTPSWPFRPLIAGDLIDWSSSRDFSDSIKVPDLEGYVPHVSGDHAASNELISGSSLVRVLSILSLSLGIGFNPG